MKHKRFHKGQVFRKRRESDLTTACLNLLEMYANAGRILYADRLNSGRIFIADGHKRRMVRLCKDGTPDSFCILKTGEIVWIEYKTKNRKLTPHQEAFRQMVKGVNHRYWVIRDVEDLEKALKEVLDET